MTYKEIAQELTALIWQSREPMGPNKCHQKFGEIIEQAILETEKRVRKETAKKVIRYTEKKLPFGLGERRSCDCSADMVANLDEIRKEFGLEEK